MHTCLPTFSPTVPRRGPYRGTMLTGREQPPVKLHQKQGHPPHNIPGAANTKPQNLKTCITKVVSHRYEEHTQELTPLSSFPLSSFHFPRVEEKQKNE